MRRRCIFMTLHVVVPKIWAMRFWDMYVRAWTRSLVPWFDLGMSELVVNIGWFTWLACMLVHLAMPPCSQCDGFEVLRPGQVAHHSVCAAFCDSIRLLECSNSSIALFTTLPIIHMTQFSFQNSWISLLYAWMMESCT